MLGYLVGMLPLGRTVLLMPSCSVLHSCFLVTVMSLCRWGLLPVVCSVLLSCFSARVMSLGCCGLLMCSMLCSAMAMSLGSCKLLSFMYSMLYYCFCLPHVTDASL